MISLVLYDNESSETLSFGTNIMNLECQHILVILHVQMLSVFVMLVQKTRLTSCELWAA